MIRKAFFWLLLTLFNISFYYIIYNLFVLRNYGLGTIFAVFLIIANLIVFSEKAYPYRYTLPAIFFLLLLTIYPMYYTVKTAFTNYGTGHFFTRQKAIEILLNDPMYIYEPSDAKGFSFAIFVNYDENLKPTEDFLILLYDKDELYLALKPEYIKRDSKGNLIRAYTEMRKLENNEVEIKGIKYKLISLSYGEGQRSFSSIISSKGKKYFYFYSPEDSSTYSNLPFYNLYIRQKYLKALQIEDNTGKKYMLSSKSLFRRFVESYRIYELKVEPIVKNGKMKVKTFIYNTLTGKPLIEKDGAFWDYDKKGQLKRVIGYLDYVGLFQFERMIKDPRISKPFLRIFMWTFTYAALSVVFSFAIGMGIALILNDRNLRGRLIYRTLLIIPWAIPAFISVLIWRNGFFNETYGIINRFIITKVLGLEPIKWLNDPFWAKVSVLIVNTWLGFPYMMTITLGALQSIPDELYEAASIDGATKWQRFIKITFPLLMVALAPLLVSSFAFNFNNFVNIYLLTGGGPAMPGTNTPAGATDILISYTYKLAFEGGRGQDFGFASAISILIFAIVSVISYFNFKFSRAFEEVSR